MKQNGWCVVLSVTFVVLLFCAVRAVRGPAASDGAQRVAADDSPAQVDEQTLNPIRAAYEMPLGHLEAVREAQRVREREAAHELQLRELGAQRP